MRLVRADNASEYYNLTKNATIKALKTPVRNAAGQGGTCNWQGLCEYKQGSETRGGIPYGICADGSSDKTVAALLFTSLTG